MVGFRELLPCVHGRGDHGDSSVVDTWLVIRGQDSTHIAGVSLQPPRAQGFCAFLRVRATTCSPCGRGRDVWHHRVQGGHGRHNQFALASSARACCSGPALPAPTPAGCATIFVQCNFLYFLGCFQLGNLKMSDI